LDVGWSRRPVILLFGIIGSRGGPGTLAQVYGREATTRWHKVCTCYMSLSRIKCNQVTAVARSIRGRVICMYALSFFFSFFFFLFLSFSCWSFVSFNTQY
jgi:hypothetical protein